MRGIHFRNYVKFACRENKISLAHMYFGAFNKKKPPLFDKSFMTQQIFDEEYLHQTILSFKEYVSVECLKATIKMCSEN